MYTLPNPIPTKPAPKLGPRLGHGGYKQVHVHPEDSDKVIIVTTWHDDYREEIKNLNTLESMGIPVLKIYDVWQNENTLYAIADKCACGSKDRGDVKFEVILNDNTIKSVRTITEVLAAKDLYIQDFQFLIANDGSIVVNDPQTIRPNSGGQHRSHVQALESYESGAKLANAIRSGKARGIESRNRFEFLDMAHRWVKEERKRYDATEEKWAANHDIYTQRKVRVFL